MVEVYAIGKIVKRRELIGYKLLNMQNYSVKNYSIDKIKELLSKGNVIGNLYIEDNELKEYFCTQILTEYSSNDRRVGKPKDTFLTVYMDASLAGLKNLHSSEVYYSTDNIVETKDMMTLSYMEHYDVDNLNECLPFLNDKPIDMYVKKYQDYYKSLTLKNKRNNIGYSVELNNMGGAVYCIFNDLNELKVGFCRGLEKLNFEELNIHIDNLYINKDCGVILPGAIHNTDFKNIIIDTCVCSKAFMNCNIERVNIENVLRASKDDMFFHCNIHHLILPSWYDSWSILETIDNIEILELTNLTCTNSIWEIKVKDKLLFRKVSTLLLPPSFDFEQEKLLREELVGVDIKRKVE